jgi:hypothetical protein
MNEGRTALPWTALGRFGVGLMVSLAMLASRLPAAADDNQAPRPVARPEHRIDWSPHLYVGMWTSHLKHDVFRLQNNWVAGFSDRGFFGATFINSFGKRAFTGGLQRSLAGTQRPSVNVMVGYRLGFVTGYDGRLMRLARDTPVLPLLQPFVALDVKHVGIEVQYTFVIASAALSYRF